MIKEVVDGLIVKIKIVPNSSKNDIVIEDEFIKVKVTAQPIENKANKLLVEFLSKTFKIPKSNIEILKGELSRDKTVMLKTNDTVKKAEILKRLTKLN